MHTLTIAPLAVPASITKTSYDTIKSAKKLFLQTEKHPSSEWILHDGLSYVSMDDLYEQSDDFDILNTQIAQRLICGCDAVYAVCGRGISPDLQKCICDKSAENDTAVVILPSSGYAEAAACAAQFSLANGAIYAANAIPKDINVRSPLCIEEIDNRITAGEVKLKLSEFYPEDSEIIFAYLTDGKYETRNIKLYELDRQPECEYFAASLVLIKPYKLLELDRYGMSDVEEILSVLRSPGGCPWDMKQTHESLQKPLIEECYEVIDTIINDDTDAMCEELGDLLMQVVFHAQIETEKAVFTMRDVYTGLVKKLIFRHPHVFAHAEGVKTADDVLIAWEKLKKEEKQQKTQSEAMLAVPKSFPALMRSTKVQKRAADVGFDWSNAEDAFYKIAEEADEIREAMKEGDAAHLFEEVGDLLFAVVNVARLLKIDSELALSAAADKFTVRFCKMDELIRTDGKKYEDMTLSDMDEYWEKAKAELKAED